MHSYGKHNDTSTMRVKGHREADGGKVCVEFDEPETDGKKKDSTAVPSPFGSRSYATICMSKEHASHYPVGSMAEIHCVPKKGKPKGPRGRMAYAAEAGRAARDEYESEEDED